MICLQEPTRNAKRNVFSLLTDLEYAWNISEQSPHGMNGYPPLLGDLGRREMLLMFDALGGIIDGRASLNCSSVPSSHALLRLR
jgi:hypothetical protein